MIITYFISEIYITTTDLILLFSHFQMYLVRPWLYIGKQRDTENLPQLQAKQIRAMLQLEERVEQPGVHVLYLPVRDATAIAANDLRRGVSFILLERQLGRKVMIACAAGISRSVTFAVAAIYETEGIPLLMAYSDIVRVHSMALPHPALWKSLCLYYQQDVPYVEVLRLYNRARG